MWFELIDKCAETLIILPIFDQIARFKPTDHLFDRGHAELKLFVCAKHIDSNRAFIFDTGLLERCSDRLDVICFILLDGCRLFFWNGRWGFIIHKIRWEVIWGDQAHARVESARPSRLRLFNLIRPRCVVHRRHEELFVILPLRHLCNHLLMLLKMMSLHPSHCDRQRQDVLITAIFRAKGSLAAWVILIVMVMIVHQKLYLLFTVHLGTLHGEVLLWLLGSSPLTLLDLVKWLRWILQ